MFLTENTTSPLIVVAGEGEGLEAISERAAAKWSGSHAQDRVWVSLGFELAKGQLRRVARVACFASGADEDLFDGVVVVSQKTGRKTVYPVSFYPCARILAGPDW